MPAPTSPAAWHRIRRMTRSVERSQEILEYLQSLEAEKLLIEAAERGVAPVTAISSKLLKRFGHHVFARTITRQFVGRVVRAVLDDRGFVLTRSNVRVRNDPLFVSGAVYAQRTGSGAKEPDPLLQRFVDTLSLEELSWAFAYLASRLQNAEREKVAGASAKHNKRRR
jgi:hypothetical protein